MYNNEFFESTKVKVFPCGNRGYTSSESGEMFNPESRLQTEANYRHAGNISKGKSSYIINYEDNILECIIGGYYFEITIASEDLENLKDKYFNINIVNNIDLGNGDKTSVLGSLFITDNNTDIVLDKNINGTYYFTGIKISDEKGTNHLKVFDEAGNIIEFNKTQISLEKIASHIDEVSEDNTIITVGNIDDGTTGTIKQRIDSIENGIVKEGLTFEVTDEDIEIKY